VTVSYLNKKGKDVIVQVSNHAILQYRDRWNRVNPEDQITFEEAERRITKYFPIANRVQNLSSKEQRRIKKYGSGSDTLYFRSCFFTYVVCNGIMTTIELSDKDLRPLNKPLRIR